eukprot:650931-Hanusia_phi.AAC.1
MGRVEAYAFELSRSLRRSWYYVRYWVSGTFASSCRRAGAVTGGCAKEGWGEVITVGWGTLALSSY